MTERRIASNQLPQADHLPRLLDVIEAIEDGKFTTGQIAKECRISKRQAGYYRLAGISLRLLRLDKGKPYPTTLGTFMANLEDEDEKKLVMRPIILLNPAVRIVFEALEDAGEGLSLEEVGDILRSVGGVSPSTRIRRAQTILRWLSWTGLAERRRAKFCASDFH